MSKFNWFRASAENSKAKERHLKANDRLFNSQFNYVDNSIKTSKYTVWTFLPLNLFAQFKRLANVYFLGLLVLKFIPHLSPLSPVTTACPLAFVLLTTAVKDAYDDYYRRLSDKKLNERSTSVVDYDIAVPQQWQRVRVGDVVRLNNDDSVPADLLVLTTSNASGSCFVETAELDGETNLKWRQCLKETAVMGDDESQLGSFDAEAVVEAPNNQLYKFEGRLTWNNVEYSLSNANVMLRGCVLRNTEWCYGLVLYSGSDTKIMNNTGRLSHKCTAVDRALNDMTIGAVVFLIALCLVCVIGKVIWEWTDAGAGALAYVRWDHFVPGGSLYELAILFTSYIIVFNTIIPISLYVSVELVRLAHSLFIGADERMIDTRSGKRAEARSSTLNEDLGQVGYVFSDKTGTLTQNVMTFKKCSILGVNYGEALARSERMAGAHLDEFFRNLALCHTALPSERNDAEYRAESPDETALVAAAARMGYTFKARQSQWVTVETCQNGLETYQVLATLEFDNVRRRMSVIVKRPDGTVRLYCKGADTSVFARLAAGQEDLTMTTKDHVTEFATDGYRTLCFAYRDVDSNDFDEWFDRYREALATGDQQQVDESIEAMESELILSGASAVEDKLQDGVPETLEKLKMAGIKIWVLTGDKIETAINIGYSSALLNRDMAIRLVNGSDEVQVERQLVELNDEMDRWNDSREPVQFGLVINGPSLVYALNPRLEKAFVQVTSRCSAVVCCRATPIQKSMVVDLVKTNIGSAVTLAIGDGANDVPMIRRAHIGVGVSAGHEGAQAVLASDFSIAQFRFLERLLLVHGRLSYLRIARFLRYFFYKSIAFTMPHFFFALFCGFSGRAVYDSFYITLYNICYTSWPVLLVGIFERDVDDAASLEYPKLYTPGQVSLFFNKWKFAKSIGLAVYTAFVAFVIAYLTFETATAGHAMDDNEVFASVLGVLVMHSVTFRVLIDSSFHTAFNFVATFGSLIFYFIAEFSYALIVSGTFDNGLAKAMGESSFWLALLLMDAVLFVPPMASRAFKTTLFPALPVRIKLVEKKRNAQLQRVSETSPP